MDALLLYYYSQDASLLLTTQHTSG